MIIVRAPLRISIGGGGTDLPSYYRNNDGTIFSSLAINKYIYVSINKRFSEKILLRYSENEELDSPEQISHPIIRETLLNLSASIDSIEITSTSDVPSGTGLGSSGTFGVCFQTALRQYLGVENSKKIAAEQSTFIEMDVLKRPIGLQDQYIASYGGLTKFKVNRHDEVSHKTYDLNSSQKNIIEDNLLLFFADVQRDASKVLSSDQKKMNDKKYGFDEIISMGEEMCQSLLKGDLKNYGSIMHDYWIIKRNRQKDFTDQNIAKVYDHVFSEGLIHGGKLVGAGGSGFLLFCTSTPKDLRKTMKEIGLRELQFKADECGVKILEN